MNYSYIIKRAFQITWRYKFLWIFGILMALCGQGGGSRADFQMNMSTRYESGDAAPQFPAFFPEPLGQTPIWIYLVAGFLLFVIFGVISLVVGAIGRGALIKTVDRLENGEGVSFGQSWNDGLDKLSPLALLQLLLFSPLVLLGIIFITIFFMLFWPFFSQLILYQPSPDSPELPPFMNDFFVVFPLFFITICGGVCLFFGLQLVISLFLTFGSRAIVLEGQGVLSAFGRSWRLFRQNIGPTLLFGLLIIAIGFVANLLVAIPGLMIMFPVMFSRMPAFLSEAGPSLADFVLLGAAGVLVALISSFFGGVVQVFAEALWTLAYREFAAKTGSPSFNPV